MLHARDRKELDDRDAVVAVLEDGQLLPELAEPAERDDPERVHRRSVRPSSDRPVGRPA
jgi:hypothetical protein